MNNKNLVNEYQDKKIVLNRSAIKEEEVHNFERETGINVFYNLGNFNDRLERIKSVDGLLIKLGFDKQEIKKGFLSKLQKKIDYNPIVLYNLRDVKEKYYGEFLY